jgi:hypothetical protein
MPSVINRVLGILARSSDAISASGSLDVLRYGRAAQPHAGRVRGVGWPTTACTRQQRHP